LKKRKAQVTLIKKSQMKIIEFQKLKTWVSNPYFIGQSFQGHRCELDLQIYQGSLEITFTLLKISKISIN